MKIEFFEIIPKIHAPSVGLFSITYEKSNNVGGIGAHVPPKSFYVLFRETSQRTSPKLCFFLVINDDLRKR